MVSSTLIAATRLADGNPQLGLQTAANSKVVSSDDTQPQLPVALSRPETIKQDTVAAANILALIIQRLKEEEEKRLEQKASRVSSLASAVAAYGGTVSYGKTRFDSLIQAGEKLLSGEATRTDVMQTIRDFRGLINDTKNMPDAKEVLSAILNPAEIAKLEALAKDPSTADSEQKQLKDFASAFNSMVKEHPKLESFAKSAVGSPKNFETIKNVLHKMAQEENPLEQNQTSSNAQQESTSSGMSSRSLGR